MWYWVFFQYHIKYSILWSEIEALSSIQWGSCYQNTLQETPQGNAPLREKETALTQKNITGNFCLTQNLILTFFLE